MFNHTGKHSNNDTSDNNYGFERDRKRKRSNDIFNEDTFNDVIKMYKLADKYENSIFMAGDNEIHFNTHVDGETISRIKKLIAIIIDDNKDKLVKFDENGCIPANRENDSPVVITYIVNSNGGSVHDVLDFVDYINFLRCTFSNIRFTSIITGMVASAGTIMCIIADKRQMTRFAFAMIHELSTGVARTNYTRIMTHADFIQNVHNVLVTIYLESRNISIDDHAKIKELEELLINETWMDPQQYKSYGFIDDVIAVHSRN